MQIHANPDPDSYPSFAVTLLNQSYTSYILKIEAGTHLLK
jgi:hypothetical protein